MKCVARAFANVAPKEKIPKNMRQTLDFQCPIGSVILLVLKRDAIAEKSVGCVSFFSCAGRLQLADGDAEASRTCHAEFHDCLGGHLLAGDGVGLRVGLVVGVLSVGIDGGLILDTRFQEI